MNNLEKNLIDNLGFSSKKAKIYITLLELGEATASSIAKKSLLKRTTVYNILPELMQAGLITTTKRQKKKYFFIEDPRRLKEEVEEKMENISKIIPNLQTIQNIFPYKPKITFYEGLGGVKEIYDDITKSTKPGEKILSIVGPNNLYKFLPEEIVRKYVTDRIKKKVINQMICSNTQIAREWQRTAQKELREIKIIQNDKIIFQADMKIYGNKVSFISYKENYMGVIIESSEISQLQKQAFEIMWQAL